jgi:hypothetical protein
MDAYIVFRYLCAGALLLAGIVALIAMARGAK